MKKTGKYLRRSVESFVAFLFFYLIFSLYGGIIPSAGEAQTNDICIYVQSNGVHTDVCLPTITRQIDWTTYISKDDFPENSSFEYIAFGWGDKGFFLDTPTWGELKVSTALTAAFLPSPTAMHVAYDKEPDLTDQKRKIYISAGNYRQLIRFIKRSFRHKNKAVELIKGKGYAQNDNFYEANETYHLFRTCNSWTNKALKSAGVKSGVYALFPDGILRHLNVNYAHN